MFLPAFIFFFKIFLSVFLPVFLFFTFCGGKKWKVRRSEGKCNDRRAMVRDLRRTFMSFTPLLRRF